MKKRIFIDMIMLTVISLILAAAALCFVFYSRFSAVAKDELRQRAELFQNADIHSVMLQSALLRATDIRITLIAADGSVIFDNAAPAARLGSHSDREEIAEATEFNVGESKRISDTLRQETYYYAVRLSDGSVLRTAKTTSSIWGMFSGALPAVITIIFAITAACYFAAGSLTKRIVAPINSVNLTAQSDAPYDELAPFIQTIKKQRERITAQFSDLQTVEKIRREFSANVSHELKTPLTSIYGHAEMLASGMVRESDYKEFYSKIKDEAARMITLIEDIILISELDENLRQDTFEDVNLAEIAAEAADALSMKASEHNVSVTINGGAVMSAGRSMMYEMFYNLIDNAIKYNKPAGTVNIQIAAFRGKTEISVSDTGIGIPPEAQSRVFERFYRVDKSRSKKTGGTGLGLAIVKHIVLLHKGKTVLKSAENVGTTIKIIFE